MSANESRVEPFTPFRPDVTYEHVRSEMYEFAAERDWHQFHTPRNLLLALVGEVGELAELFQWRGEVKPMLPDWNERDRQLLGEELSDVLLYLTRLSDRCGIDLPTAALRKMARNREKYPASQAKGKSDKYTAYATTVGQAGTAAAAATTALITQGEVRSTITSNQSSPGLWGGSGCWGCATSSASSPAWWRGYVAGTTTVMVVGVVTAVAVAALVGGPRRR